MLVLGIESSCDETAAAVLADGTLRSNIVESQDPIHSRYGGVVPELASRRHLEVVLPVVGRALDEAGVRLPDLDGIAVTHGPGLVGSLLVGLSVAKALAYAHRLPLVGVNHLEGHIFAGRLADPTLEPPFLALVVSGGHTALYACEVPLRYRLIGQTRDDAAGEAFDKVAKLLGLGYPGGPAVERTARAGDPKAIPFPFAQFQDRAPDFSFSGLKTAVSLYVRRHAPLTPEAVADVCASFQATAVKMLVRKAVRAARELRDPADPPHRRRRGQRRPARGPRGRVRRARLPMDGAPSAALHGQRGDDRRRRHRAPRRGRAGRPRAQRPCDPPPRVTP